MRTCARIGDDLRTRHGDMVWKIRLCDEWCHVYAPDLETVFPMQ
jgi:hypothetical protein